MTSISSEIKLAQVGIAAFGISEVVFGSPGDAGCLVSNAYAVVAGLRGAAAGMGRKNYQQYRTLSRMEALRKLLILTEKIANLGNSGAGYVPAFFTTQPPRFL